MDSQPDGITKGNIMSDLLKSVIAESGAVTIVEKLENIISIGETKSIDNNKTIEGIAITIKPKAAIELRNLLNNIDLPQIQ